MYLNREEQGENIAKAQHHRTPHSHHDAPRTHPVSILSFLAHMAAPARTCGTITDRISSTPLDKYP